MMEGATAEPAAAGDEEDVEDGEDVEGGVLPPRDCWSHLRR
jgi:hypothetical protein